MKKVVLFFLPLFVFSCTEPEIETPEPDPVANFSFTENGNFAPSLFTFTNTSSNGYTYTWDFGDGGSSLSENPTHKFTTGGLYNVTLSVKNKKGIQNVINKTITVKNAPTSLTINSITLTSFPATMLSGGGWDSSDGPDVFPILINSTGTTSFSSSRKENLLISNLPTTYTTGFPYTISNFDFQNDFSFYDYDSLSANDYMGGYYITIRNYIPTDGSKYPTSINIQNSASSTLKFTLNLTWVQ